MDFAICPSCKQSVLDDDAVNCPFCGASMKAKPGSAKSGTTAPAVAAQAGGGKPSPPKVPVKAAAEDDSPFDLTEGLQVSAIQATATKTKSRTLQVKCPMCETVGYVTPDAAGQAVKCANPKCLVPIFNAPAPEPERPPPPPPKPKRSLLMVGGVTVAIMAAGGVIAWWIAGQPAATTLKGPSAEDLELVKEMAQRPPTTNEEKEGPKTGSTDQPTGLSETRPAMPPEVWRNSILKAMNDASLQPRQNRSKPFCRRLTAEAFALVGNLEGAQEQLTALDKVGKDVPFYRVMPLVEIAWQQLARGERKSASKTVEQAWQAAASLPKTGRDRLESAIALGALLVADRRESDARALLETHQSGEGIAQLAAARRAVYANQTYDLSQAAARRPPLPWQSPLEVGVVYELVGRGRGDAARKWATNLGSERAQAEALAAWAEGSVWLASLQQSDVAIDTIRSTLESLPAPGNVLALARLGYSLTLADQLPEAEKCLTLASRLLAAAPTFTEEPLPDDVGELARFTPADPGPREFLASAAAETARLAMRLKRSQEAEAAVKTALAQVRSLAPNPVHVERRLKQFDSVAATNALREELKQRLKLRSRDDAIVAANAFKKNLDELAEAGRRRVELQRQLLSDAAEWGLLDLVWNYIRRGTTPEDAVEADNLIFTPLSGLLAEKYQALGKSDRYELVTGAWKQLAPDRPFPEKSPETTLREALESAKTADFQRAVETIRALKQTPAAQDALAMTAASRLAAAGRCETALTFVARLHDQVLKEECYLLVAALAARHTEVAAVERQLTEVPQASEKVALGRGLIGGEVARSSMPGSGPAPERKE